jgi:hypothetical protein
MGEPLLFLLVAGAGVAVGLARGGRLGWWREHGVKAARLGLACLAVQAFVVMLPLRAVGLPLVLGAVLLLTALAVLLGVARANGRLPGVPLLALGLLLNLLVVLQHLVRGPGPFRREDGTAHGAHEARTVPWTTWAE